MQKNESGNRIFCDSRILYAQKDICQCFLIKSITSAFTSS